MMIVKAFEAGTRQAPPNRSAIMKAHREYAAATFRVFVYRVIRQ